MFKSILAVSQGGPEARSTFGLARRVADTYGGAVDALYLPKESVREQGGFLLPSDRDRLQSRARECKWQYEDSLAGVPGSTYTADSNLPPLETLTSMGRFSDLIVIGRPGEAETAVSPDMVRTAIHESARAVLIAPPKPVRPFNSVIVAWNGTFQATRAIEYAMPFLAKANSITILVVGREPEEVGASLLARNFRRHGLPATIGAIDPGFVSGRARGRALLNHTHDSGAELLVMGAYGGGRLQRFLGVGGATGKVISSCMVPVLIAH